MLNTLLVLLIILTYTTLIVLTIFCWKEVVTNFEFVYLFTAICLTIIVLLPIGYFYDEYAKEKAVTKPPAIKQELQLIEGDCHD